MEYFFEDLQTNYYWRNFFKTLISNYFIFEIFPKSQKLMISSSCICGLMSNLHKIPKWTLIWVSVYQVLNNVGTLVSRIEDPVRFFFLS